MADLPEIEEDNVVQEIDVYLSKNLMKKLYLFQYPVRPSNSPYDSDQFIQARVKPEQQKIELEVSVNTRSQNYDRGKGEQIVLNSRSDGSETNYFESKYLDKQLLCSNKSTSNTNRYAVGLLRPGELHLVPLHGMVQMRPNVSYLDISDPKNNEKQKNAGDEDEEDEPKAVTVKFAAPQTEKAKLAKEKSFWYQQQKMKNEPWVKMNVHATQSARSNLETSRLFCSKMDHDASELPCLPEDYLARLVSAGSSDYEETIETAPVKEVSVADQVRNILLSAKVVCFSELQELISVTDPSILLRALQPLALLVQGCWVIKSEVLYPKDTFSPLSRVAAETLCKVRDFVVWKFTEETFLSRSQLPENLKLPDDDWKCILSDLANYNPIKRGWSFKYPRDTEFIEFYVEVVERQQMLWNARSQQMAKFQANSPQKSATIINK